MQWDGRSGRENVDGVQSGPCRLRRNERGLASGGGENLRFARCRSRRSGLLPRRGPGGANWSEGRVIARDVDRLIAQCQPGPPVRCRRPVGAAWVVSAGLEAGCHVLSEKPMAETLDEARDLVARAKPPDGSTPWCRTVVTVAGIRRIARALRGRDRRYRQRSRRFLPCSAFWRVSRGDGPCLLLDMAIHTFDALRCMTGLAASGVYCREWNPPHSWYRDGSSAAAIFDLETGAIFIYRGSWCAQGLPTSWECRLAFCRGERVAHLGRRR